MAEASTESWTCPGCMTVLASRFCPRCGEAPVPKRELTLRRVLHMAWNEATSLDARTLRSIAKLLRHPGELTLAWTHGLRKPFIAPFQLFLLMNVLFFATQSLTGENVFSSTLDSHLHHQDWSELTQSLVARHLAGAHTTLDAFAPLFDQAVVLNAKSLILVMVLPFSLLLPLAFLRERRPFVTHVTFGLHLYAFLLVVFSVALVAAKLSAALGWGGLDTPHVDTVLTLANLAACATYIAVAIGPVYGASSAARIVKALFLALAVGAIVLAYRFALLLITLYTT